jgi:IgGFc binding protein
VFSGNDFAIDGYEPPLVNPVHLVEQLPPVTDWGFTFYLVSFPNVNDGFTYRIVTATPNNNVVIQTSGSTSSSTFTLNSPGQVATYNQPDGQFVVVKSSGPVLVAQFAGGTSQGGEY